MNIIQNNLTQYQLPKPSPIYQLPPPSYTSLDYTGTSEPDQAPSRSKRDRKWMAEVLRRVDERQAESFLQCGAIKTVLQCDTCGWTHKVKYHCRLRVCPECMKDRQWRMVKRYLKALMRRAGGQHYRFVTLTIKNSADLARDVRRAREAWKRLRRDRYIKKRVWGGVYAIEAVQARDGEGRRVTDEAGRPMFNVHVHIVYWGLYVSQGVLSYAWERETGDSYVVWIEDLGIGVDGAREGLRYITKYLAKGAVDMWEWDEGAIEEYMRVLRNARLVQGFGAFMGALKVLDEEKLVCPVCGGDIWNVYDETGTILIAGPGTRPPPFDDWEREQAFLEAFVWLRCRDVRNPRHP